MAEEINPKLSVLLIGTDGFHEHHMCRTMGEVFKCITNSKRPIFSVVINAVKLMEVENEE